MSSVEAGSGLGVFCDVSTFSRDSASRVVHLLLYFQSARMGTLVNCLFFCFSSFLLQIFCDPLVVRSLDLFRAFRTMYSYFGIFWFTSYVMA